jgi:hypothetical protein
MPPADDACPLAMAGQGAQGQSDVNGIASWKAARTGAWVGLGVGAAALATGATLELLAHRSRGRVQGLRDLVPTPVLGAPAEGRAWGIAWSGRF